MEISIERDGLTLRGQLEGAQGLEVPELAILCHGFKGNIGADKSSLIYDLSQRLNAVGIPTLRVNFNGCGNSDGKFQDMTIWNEMCDLLAIIDYARVTLKTSKIHLIGHSQGGVVASIVAPAFKDIIANLILLAPASSLVKDAQRGLCQGTSYNPHAIPDQVEVGEVSVSGNYFRIAQYLPVYDLAKNYDGQVLVIHSQNDTVVSIIASQEYVDTYIQRPEGRQKTHWHFLAHGGHNLMNQGPGDTVRHAVKDTVCFQILTHR